MESRAAFKRGNSFLNSPFAVKQRMERTMRTNIITHTYSRREANGWKSARLLFLIAREKLATLTPHPNMQ